MSIHSILHMLCISKIYIRLEFHANTQAHTHSKSSNLHCIWNVITSHKKNWRCKISKEKCTRSQYFSLKYIVVIVFPEIRNAKTARRIRKISFSPLLLPFYLRFVVKWIHIQTIESTFTRFDLYAHCTFVVKIP